MNDKKTNIKQDQFCRYYIEEKGNATKAYMRAYNVKTYATAKAGASRMLTFGNILSKIGETLQKEGLNDLFVDLQLYDLIQQSEDLNIKIRAIAEYNKIKKRYGENYNISQSIGVISLPEKVGDTNCFINPEDMTESELKQRIISLRQAKQQLTQYN